MQVQTGIDVSKRRALQPGHELQALAAPEWPPVSGSTPESSLTFMSVYGVQQAAHFPGSDHYSTVGTLGFYGATDETP